MKVCPKCGKEFKSDNVRRVYCNDRCYKNAKMCRHYRRFVENINREKYKCNKCGIEYLPTHKTQRYCSSDCANLAQTKFLDIPSCLEDASRKLDKKIGYIRVYCPMHPMANTWGYVYEHRLIVESILGRHLNNNEHIHHINGKRWDNRPENLKVLSPSEHAKLKRLGDDCE